MKLPATCPSRLRGGIIIDMLKWRKFIASCLLCVALGLPAGAARAASSSDDEEVLHDARTEGYQANVKIEKNGTALTWLLFVFLVIIGVAALFKDPKRSHLD
jgi:hypothetical protein